MVATELSPEDMELAMSLLAAKKGAELAKENFTKRLKADLAKIYESLDVPKGDLIRFVQFLPKQTRIWAYITTISYSEVWVSNVDVPESLSIDGYWESLERNEIPDRRRMIPFLGHTHGSRRRHDNLHTFYLDEINMCPFCGEKTSSKNNLDSCLIWTSRKFCFETGMGETFIVCDRPLSHSDFFDSPIKLKRCDRHKKLSRVQYLRNEEYDPKKKRVVSGWRDGSAKKELYDKIYPKPIKHSKNYYAEKRVKKVKARRSLTKSETSFFTMLLGASKLAQITPQKHEIPSNT